MLKRFTQSPRPILALFACVYLALSLYIMANFGLTSLSSERDWESLSDTPNTAAQVLLYRALVPKMAETVFYFTPDSVRDGANVALKRSHLTGMLENTPNLHLPLLQRHLYMRAVLFLITFGFLWVYIVSLYKLGRRLYPEQWSMALFAPIIGLALIPCFAFAGFDLYDFAVLGLAAACYCCMASETWGWFMFWFALASLNRETAAFIMLFYILWFIKRYDSRRFLLFWIPQCTLYAIVKLSATLYFMQDPGDFLEFRPGHVLPFGFLFYGYRVGNMALVLGAFFLAGLRWKEKPAFARTVVWLVMATAVAYLFFAPPNEYRGFCDIFPLVAMLFTHTLVMGTDIHKWVPFNIPGQLHVA